MQESLTSLGCIATALSGFSNCALLILGIGGFILLIIVATLFSTVVAASLGDVVVLESCLSCNDAY